MYLFSTPSNARGSASKAEKWGQPVVSPGSEVAGRETSKVTSVDGTDSSPNKVGWVVSEDVVDMVLVALLWARVAWNAEMSCGNGNGNAGVSPSGR